MSKQDRQGVRTAAQLEQKYDFNQDVATVIEIAENASRTADAASRRADAAVSAATTAKNMAENNAEDITALGERVDTLEESGGGGINLGLSVVDGVLCVTYKEEQS